MLLLLIYYKIITIIRKLRNKSIKLSEKQLSMHSIEKLLEDLEIYTME